MESKRHPVPAAAVAGVSVFAFIVMPVLVSAQIASNFPELSRDRLDNISFWALRLGPVIVLISATATYFEKGSMVRLTFGLLTSALLLTWMYLIFNGFIITSRYEDYPIRIDISGLLLLFLVVIALKTVYTVAEFLVWRNTDEGPGPGGEDGPEAVGG